MASTTIVTDTAAKDYDSIVQSLIDFATSQYGEQTSANRVWTDFNISSFSRNWAELVAYVGDQLMFYLDTHANQAHLASATIPSFILDIAQQLGYEVPTQQAASGRVQFTTTGPYTIPSGYRVFSGDVEFFTTREVLGSRAETVEVEVIQGSSRAQSFTSAGIQNEQFVLPDSDVIVDLTNPNANLQSPQVIVNGNAYRIVTTPVDAAPNSLIVVRSIDVNGRMVLTFGDGIFGRRLAPNEAIQIRYRAGGGSQGNLEPGEITDLSTVLDNVASVTNTSRTNGGVDQLSLAQIKARIPLSLETRAGAVDLDGYADILIANFPQVLTAKSAINTNETGIDIDIFVIPQADTVTDITDNPLLRDNLTDFLERKKTVTTRFLIRNGEEILVDLEIEAFLNRDASRASVESDLRERIAELFDLRTGNIDGTGMKFAQNIRVRDLFEVISQVPGISRFEVVRHTIVPRIEQIVNSPNQNFYVSRVSVYDNSEVNEWLVATDELANPEPISGQVGAAVYKRTLATVTSVTEDSITDSDLDLTVLEGNALVISNVIVTDPRNVFNLGQYDDFLLVDRDNNVWRIEETRSSSLVVSSPSLTDASVTTVASGAYRVVKSFAGQRVAVSGASFTILYNNRNTFFSPAASFNLITTVRSPFFLSERQTNRVTYGVPVAITSVTAQGPNAGDLVEIGFNGNPNLQAVDNTYVLVDRTGEVFEVAEVQDNDSVVAEYDNQNLINGVVVLTDTGDDQSISMPFIAEKQVTGTFVEITTYLRKVDSPLGNIVVDIAEDNAGEPGAILVSSIPFPCGSILIDNFNQYSFTFATEVTLAADTTYHLIVRGDNAYRLSFAANDGLVEVGVDTLVLGYKPSATASTSLSILNNAGISVVAKSQANVEIIDNNIRSRLQAIATLSIDNVNQLGSAGTYNYTIGGQTFSAVIGAPGPTGQFQAVSGDLPTTRTNLINAWNAQAGAIATATALGTNLVLFTANSANYPGEAGNSLDTDITQSTPGTWAITEFGGGVTGDSIVLEAPKYLNSPAVAYTYNPATGIVQFPPASGLPASAAIDDVFIDGAGNKFPIVLIQSGLDRVVLATSLEVNTDIDSLPSGSIYGSYTFEFGDGALTVGADADASATNLAARINTVVGAFVTATPTANDVEIEADVAGSFANDWVLSDIDSGIDNFEITEFSGGSDADVIEINGVNLTAVPSAPADNQFIPGATPTDTLLAIQAAILTSPSLIGVVNATLIAGPSLAVSAVVSGTSGNSITSTVVTSPNNAFQFASPTLVGGQDNLRLLSFDGADWSDSIPDADLIFAVRVASDSLLVVAKIDDTGTQVIPQVSIGSAIDSALGKRYYSDNGEVSFLVASVSPNSFIVGASDVDLYGRGTVEGNAGVRVDQFIFRTSKIDDDVTNLRENEIPVLEQADLKINLLGGVT
jgi:hypothetical protein